MQLQSGKETYLTGERFSHALARTSIADEFFPVTRLGLTDFFEKETSSWALYILKGLIFEFQDKKLNQLIGECYIHGVMYGETWSADASPSFEEFIVQ